MKTYKVTQNGFIKIYNGTTLIHTAFNTRRQIKGLERDGYSQV